MEAAIRRISALVNPTGEIASDDVEEKSGIPTHHHHTHHNNDAD
jgi:hypothetical protein